MYVGGYGVICDIRSEKNKRGSNPRNLIPSGFLERKNEQKLQRNLKRIFPRNERKKKSNER
jgi:hypothetical protein